MPENPTAEEMIQIAREHQGQLIGRVNIRPKEHARITVTGFEIKVNDNTARKHKKELVEREIGPDEFKSDCMKQYYGGSGGTETKERKYCGFSQTAKLIRVNLPCGSPSHKPTKSSLKV